MAESLKISPKTLLWASERGGISYDSLFEIYPKAIEWIREESEPSVKQLEEFARKVHVPFGYLFLQNPPEESLPITFYRSNGKIISNPPINIRDLVNELKLKQDWLVDFLTDNSYDKLEFIGLLKNFKSIKIQEAANIIRRSLKVNITWYQSTNKQKAFRYWIDEIEKNRIIVISTGFIKNNKRSIDVEICKGFTLVNEYCPFIYINTQNLGGGKLFTLIHELVHVFVGSSIGIGYEPIHPSSQPLERFCDKVASEILVPNDYFKSSWISNQGNYQYRIEAVCKYYHVSKLVIARKALDNKFITKNEYWDYYNYYINAFENKKTNGGLFWNSKPYEVSRKFYEFVDSALNSGKLLPSKAYKLTNMKGKSYDNFRSKGL